MQYNKDNRYYENVERSTVSIRTMCGIMLDKSLGNAVSILSIPMRSGAHRNFRSTSIENKSLPTPPPHLHTSPFYFINRLS